ncbi:MAG TPA: hypothetical protein VIF10_16615 [Methylobacter sp.]
MTLLLLLIFVLLYSMFRNIIEPAIVMLANIMGLIPIMWATGAGADVTKRIAAGRNADRIDIEPVGIPGHLQSGLAVSGTAQARR